MASRISMTFFDDFQDTFGRPKKEQVIGWNQIAGSKMQSCSAVTKFQEGPPFPLAFWRIFCSHFLPTANGWRFMVGCLGSFARKWGGCDVCPGWRGGQMFLGPSSPLKNWRQVKRWTPPKPVGFFYPRFKNLPFWFGEGSFRSITWCKWWYIHVYNFYI